MQEEVRTNKLYSYALSLRFSFVLFAFDHSLIFKYSRPLKSSFVLYTNILWHLLSSSHNLLVALPAVAHLAVDPAPDGLLARRPPLDVDLDLLEALVQGTLPGTDVALLTEELPDLRGDFTDFILQIEKNSNLLSLSVSS